MITDKELDAFQRLCDNATPGPWAYEAYGDTGTFGVGVILDKDDNPISGESISHDLLVSEVVALEVGSSPDAAFISASRDALPRLIAEVQQRRLEKKKNDMAALVDGLISCVDKGKDCELCEFGQDEECPYTRAEKIFRKGEGE